MIDGERNLVADHLAHFGDVLLEQVDALLGEVQAGERVHDVLRVVDEVARLAVLVVGLHRMLPT
jgi:hypothetical protein